MRARRITTLALAGCLALGSLGLTACSPESIVRGAVDQVSGGNVQLGDKGSLPAGWPAEIPVIDGDKSMSVALGGADGGWSVTVTTQGDASTVKSTIDSQLTGAGFTAQLQGDTGGVGASIYTSDAYSVIVTIAATDDSGKTSVNYVVATQNG